MSHETEENFSTAAEKLLKQTIQLDYEFKIVGSGGPVLERTKAFRECVNDLDSFWRGQQKDITSLYLPQQRTLKEKMYSLHKATKGLYGAFEDFIEITVNEELMRSIIGLYNVLEKTGQLPRVQSSALDPKPPPELDILKLEKDLTEYFEAVSRNIGSFINKDIKTIDAAQRREIETHAMFTVMSTFLSGVTASVLQIVGPSTSGDSVLEVTVNITLFTSLVLSTSSALQSLLAMTWTKSSALVSFVKLLSFFLDISAK